MNLTKEGILNSSISVSAIILILPVFWWLNSKADKKEVEKVEIKIEQQKDKDQEYKLQQMKIDTQQTAILEKLDEQLKRIDGNR